MIDKFSLRADTAGASGSATGSAQTPIPIQGELLAVYLSFISQPSSVDTVLAMSGAVSEAMVSRTNFSAGGWMYPRKQVMDNTGQVLAYASSASQHQAVADPYVIHDHVKLDVTGGDPGGAVIATCYYRK